MTVANLRNKRVRCVRGLIDGHSGWLVRWIDYRLPVWRQHVFVRDEADARALVRMLRSGEEPEPVKTSDPPGSFNGIAAGRAR
jgi:hypothetical protein